MCAKHSGDELGFDCHLIESEMARRLSVAKLILRHTLAILLTHLKTHYYSLFAALSLSVVEIAQCFTCGRPLMSPLPLFNSSFR